MSNSSTPCLWIAIAVATALGVSTRGAAQLTSPPVIVRGSAPSADVHAMPNSQNSLASLADGSIVALLYRQTSNSAGGHLFLAISTDIGVTWNSFHPLPHNTSHRAHGSNSGVLCGGRECNIVHVAWADRRIRFISL